MYDRLCVQVCGMFNPLHYFTIGIFFLLMALCLFCSRKLRSSQANRVVFWLGVVVTVLEVIKISTRISKDWGPDSWMPLYYCSLFLFAVWLIRIPIRCMQRAGYAFITMGGILASVGFTFYPSTSLGMYPLLSFSSFHSFFFHFVMCYSGILILWKGIYRPVRRDGLYYALFVMAACLIAIPCNFFLGTNCMFLAHPYNLPLLQPIMEYSKPLYMGLAIFAQAFVIFWLNYGLFHLRNGKQIRS